MKFLYVIGQPGSGKSTLVQALTRGSEALDAKTPFAHRIYLTEPERVVELGGRREAFSGTDVLSLSVQPRVVSWLTEARPRLVLAEGDRLANGKFFAAVGELGYDLLIARLVVSGAVAASRRAERAIRLGKSLQNEQWLQGRITKNTRLAQEWRSCVLDLDADQPPERILAELESVGNPVVRALRAR